MTNITRIRPNDLLEVQNKYTDIPLSSAIAAMQAAENRMFDCPACPGADGKPSGWIMVPKNIKHICPTCVGYLKTRQPAIFNPSKPGTYTLLVIGGAKTIKTGASIGLTASIAGGAWSSSNSSILAITSAGEITGVATGQCTVSYAIGQTSVSIPIMVTEK
jgi:hypothetical protein